MIFSRHDEEAGGIRSPCKGSSLDHNPLRRNQSDAVGRLQCHQILRCRRPRASVECDRHCRCGPGTHVWGRHVDCTRRVRVQVPRPTGRPKQCQARLKGRTRQAPQNGSSLARGRPLPRRYVTLTKAVAGQTPVGAAPSPRGSFVCTDSGNRRPVMKQRCGIQPQIGELPIVRSDRSRCDQGSSAPAHRHPQASPNTRRQLS
jgi:hypothetical protein